MVAKSNYKSYKSNWILKNKKSKIKYRWILFNSLPLLAKSSAVSYPIPVFDPVMMLTFQIKASIKL